jgi:transposase
MAVEGKLYHEVSKILGVSDFFVGYWKKQFGSNKYVVTFNYSN